MKSTSKQSRWLVRLLSLVFLLAGLTACSSSEGEDAPPLVNVGDVVENPTKVKQYEDTQQFKSDLDALVTYALSLQSFRVYYWGLLSNGFEDGQAFCSTPEYINDGGGSFIADRKSVV